MTTLLERIESTILPADQVGILTEAQIQFNKNRNVGFGNVVILAGGAGSGKGFTLSQLIGLEGKVLDVDAVKQLAIKVPKINRALVDAFGPEANSPDFLRTPKNVSNLHVFLKDQGIIDKREAVLWQSIAQAAPDRKPNLIFDVTLKDLTKVVNISNTLQELGYKPEKIHLVWVLNDLKIALDQNAKRSRVVPEDILRATHMGASSTVFHLIQKSKDFQKFINGDWYISFNRAKIDVELAKSESGGAYILNADYAQLKTAGKPINTKQIGTDLLNKIKMIVPNPEIWNLG